MTKTRFILLSSLLGSMVLVAGCRALAGNKCLKPPSDADTHDQPLLRAPVGLDAPDTSAALKVPPLAANATAPASSKGCLEEPPLIEALPDRGVTDKEFKKAAREAGTAPSE